MAKYTATTGNGKIPLEIKSGWLTRSKSLHIYEEKHCPPVSVVLSAFNARGKGFMHRYMLLDRFSGN